MKYFVSSFIIAALLFTQTSHAASSGGSKWYRFDLGLALVGDVDSFDIVQGGVTYNHSNVTSGLDGYMRAGIRTGFISGGVVAALGMINGKAYKKTPNVVQSVTYENDYYQALGGGFIAMGPSSGPEIIAELYPTVTRTVYRSVQDSNNPFAKDDTLSGSGWGVGIGKYFPQGGWVYLFYRNISYSKAKLAGTDTEFSSDAHSKHTQNSLLLQIGKAF